MCAKTCLESQPSTVVCTYVEFSTHSTMEKYTHYFQLGHSASSARHYHIQQLKIENEERKVQQILADRSINPSESDVHRAFRAWREKNYGKDNGKEMFDKLEELVDSYKSKHCVNGGQGILQRYISANCNDNAAEQPLVLAIVTPLMARTHAHIPQVKDIAFVDSTASLDRFSSPMFIVSTASSAGGIPLGVVITSSESTHTLRQAFHQLQQIMPARSYYGNGCKKGPEIILTDDSTSERQALQMTWPETTFYYACSIIYRVGRRGCGRKRMALIIRTKFLLWELYAKWFIHTLKRN